VAQLLLADLLAACTQRLLQRTPAGSKAAAAAAAALECQVCCVGALCLNFASGHTCWKLWQQRAHQAASVIACMPCDGKLGMVVSVRRNAGGCLDMNTKACTASSGRMLKSALRVCKLTQSRPSGRDNDSFGSGFSE